MELKCFLAGVSAIQAACRKGHGVRNLNPCNPGSAGLTCHIVQTTGLTDHCMTTVYQALGITIEAL